MQSSPLGGTWAGKIDVKPFLDFCSWAYWQKSHPILKDNNYSPENEQLPTENRWLEDELSFGNDPFSDDMLTLRCKTNIFGVSRCETMHIIEDLY